MSSPKRGPLALLGLLVVLAAGAYLLGQGAGDGRRVVVYTAHDQATIDALLPRFEAATGIAPEVVKLGSGDVIQRVEAERERPQADVIWSIAGDQLEASAELLAAPGDDLRDGVDERFQVSEAWLPYTGLVVCFVVNTDLLAPEARPRTWADLARPELEGQVVMARADRSGSAFMQLVTVLHGRTGAEGAAVDEEAGWALYREILANSRLTGSSSAVPRLVNDGEAAVGVTLEDSAQRYVRGGGPVAILYPEDGTAAAPDGLALVRGAPHPEEARAFARWVLSEEVQDLLARQVGRRPVRTGAAAPDGLPPLAELPVRPYDLAWAAAEKERLVARWQELAAELGR